MKYLAFLYLGLGFTFSPFTLNASVLGTAALKQLFLTAAQEQAPYALESACEYADTLPAAYRSGYSSNISNAIFAKVRTALKTSLLNNPLISEEELETFDETLDVIVTLLARYSAGVAAQTTNLEEEDRRGAENILIALGNGTNPASASFTSKLQQAITSITEQRQPRDFGQGSYPN